MNRGDSWSRMAMNHTNMYSTREFARTYTQTRDPFISYCILYLWYAMRSTLFYLHWRSLSVFLSWIMSSDQTPYWLELIAGWFSIFLLHDHVCMWFRFHQYYCTYIQLYLFLVVGCCLLIFAWQRDFANKSYLLLKYRRKENGQTTEQPNKTHI